MDVTVSPSETLEDAAHRRWKDKTLFIAGLTFLVILFLASFGMLIFAASLLMTRKFGSLCLQVLSQALLVSRSARIVEPTSHN